MAGGDEYFAVKRIVLEGYVHGTSPDDLRARIGYLKSFLATFGGAPWRSRSPVRLERVDLGGRHWNVLYEAVDLMETVGKRDLSPSARVRITLKSLSPFARANGVTRASFIPAAGGLHALGLGSAPSDAVYAITGPASDPSFSVGDMTFFCDFSDGLAYTGAENTALTGTFSPSAGESLAYRLTETGGGLLVTTGNTASYAASGNAADGAWVVVAEPRWSSSSRTETAVVLEHYADADNSFRLFWDASAREWVFMRRADGSITEVRSPEQAFTAGTRIVLGATWDASHAGGMALYVNGERVAESSSVAVLQEALHTVTLNDCDGSYPPDAVFSLVAEWARALSADEMLRIAGDPSALSNGNVTVSWSGTLESGDLLVLDSRARTAECRRIATGAWENVLSGLSGDIPVLAPGRRRAAAEGAGTTVFTHTGAAAMEVRYRKCYL